MDGLEGFLGLTRSEGLAVLTATYNLVNVIFHSRPVVQLSGIFVCLDLPTMGHVEGVEDTAPEWLWHDHSAAL